MDLILKITKAINIIALCFLILGAYGLGITGALQVLTAALYFFIFPKSKLIYIYFGFVLLFFIVWNYESFNWLFCIPFTLIIFLSYIIHFNKHKL